jgi:hypothetical protein
MKHINNSGVWAEAVKILRAKVLDTDLHIIPDYAFRLAHVSPNLSQFLQNLKHCTGEDAEELYDTLKLSKLKVKGFGIDPNSREVVTVVVSYITGKLATRLPTTLS